MFVNVLWPTAHQVLLIRWIQAQHHNPTALTVVPKVPYSSVYPVHLSKSEICSEDALTWSFLGLVMKLHVQLQCKNLHQYLRELSPDLLDRLYNHPATCLAVYRYQGQAHACSRVVRAFVNVKLFLTSLILCRELPSLSKNFVMRMLFLDQPLPQAAVSLWVNKDNQKWVIIHLGNGGDNWYQHKIERCSVILFDQSYFCLSCYKYVIMVGNYVVYLPFLCVIWKFWQYSQILSF